MQAKRIPITKKIRFEIFKRDYFKCQYCGSVPPDVILEVDHINPVCRGGKNSIDNLITACFDCNRGKSSIELTSLPQTTEEKSKIIKEKLQQYKKFNAFQEELNNIISTEVESVADIYSTYFPEWQVSAKFKQVSIKRFVSSIGVYEVRDAMEISCSRIFDSDEAIKYFCGICWSKIRER